MSINNDYDIEHVLQRYSLMVYRLAYARTGSASDAEDIMQDVFLTLVKRNPGFPSEEDRKAWLIRVTINRANSLWRSAWRRRVYLRGVRHNHPGMEDDDIELRDAINELSSKDKVLIHLHYFEGFKLEEIAEILNCQPSTVRSRLHRARKRLGRLIAEGKLYEEEIH